MSGTLEISTAWTQERQPIALVGPTATGKTEAAIALAEQIDGEIINADSMQVYRGMDIGTAKPDIHARQRIPFHLLDVVGPEEQFTVSEWKTRAEDSLIDIWKRGRQPIICGGTGLYIRALLDDWSLAATPADAAIREQLKTEANALGTPALHAQLMAVDSVTAARLHPNDAVRIMRALEVYRVTGRPISVYQEEDRRLRPPRPVRCFGLTLPRPDLYARIDRRVDSMLAMGFENEVRGLIGQGYSPALSSMRSLGYKEMAAYLAGETNLSDAVAAIKQNTRRFAKRQQTWFRADMRIQWIDVSEANSVNVAEILREQGTGNRKP